MELPTAKERAEQISLTHKTVPADIVPLVDSLNNAIMPTESAEFWRSSRQAKRRTIKKLIARKLQPQKTKVERRIRTKKSS